MDNTLSGAVDVDATLFAVIQTAEAIGAHEMASKVRSVQAAVAELVEECERLCKAADGMKRSADGMSRRSPVAITLRTAAANILSLRPLLANVGGAK